MEAAALVLLLGPWAGALLYHLRFDSNGDLAARRARSKEAALNPNIIPHDQFGSRLPQLPLDLPEPPVWDWSQAEKVMPKTSPSWRDAVLRGLFLSTVCTAGMMAALLFYLKQTRVSWEVASLSAPRPSVRLAALESLWSHSGPEGQRRVAEWFAHAEMTAEEAEIILFRLPAIPPELSEEFIEGVLFKHSGSPGREAMTLLRHFRDRTSEEIAYSLETGLGDSGRLVGIWARLDASGLPRLLASQVKPTPNLVETLARCPEIEEKSWPGIAKAFMTAAGQDPRLSLDIMEALLAHAPVARLRETIQQEVRQRETLISEALAGNPKRYLHIALFQPRLGWVPDIARAVADATKPAITAIEVGDRLSELGTPASDILAASNNLTTETGKLLALRVLAKVQPDRGAALCGRWLVEFAHTDWGVLTPGSVERLAKAKERMDRMLQVLEGIPFDSDWVCQCSISLSFSDEGLRKRWIRRLALASLDDLLEGFRRSLAGLDRFEEKDIDSYKEALGLCPGATPRRMAEYLVQGAPQKGAGAGPVPPVLKFILLRFIADQRDPSVAPLLGSAVNDPAVLVRSSKKKLDKKDLDQSGPMESTSISLGEIAAQVLRGLEGGGAGALNMP
jgi:hypothetical protein